MVYYNSHGKDKILYVLLLQKGAESLIKCQVEHGAGRVVAEGAAAATTAACLA